MRKTIALAALLFAGLARADEASDRTDIQNVIRALNQAPSQDVARPLFTPAGFDEFERLPPPAPWSETSRPYFRVQAIRFVNPDVALANALGRELGIPMRICNLSLAEMTEALARGWAGRDSRVVMLL